MAQEVKFVGLTYFMTFLAVLDLGFISSNTGDIKRVLESSRNSTSRVADTLERTGPAIVDTLLDTNKAINKVSDSSLAIADQAVRMEGALDLLSSTLDKMAAQQSAQKIFENTSQLCKAFGTVVDQAGPDEQATYETLCKNVPTAVPLAANP